MAKRIKNLEQLAKAAKERKAVYCPNVRWARGRTPAAFVLNYSGATLLPLLKAGLYIYEPMKKKDKDHE